MKNRRHEVMANAMAASAKFSTKEREFLARHEMYGDLLICCDEDPEMLDSLRQKGIKIINLTKEDLKL